MLIVLLRAVQARASAALVPRPRCLRRQRRAAASAALSEEQQGGRAQDVQQPAASAVNGNGAEAEDDSREFAVAMAKVSGWWVG